MKPRRIIFVLLCVAMTSILLYGCGKDKVEDASVTENPDTSNTISQKSDDAENTDESSEPTDITENDARAEESPKAVAAVAAEDMTYDSLDITVDDPILYDENGVRLSFDTIKKDVGDEDMISFRLENNNPDNKKAIIENMSVNLNGLVPGSQGQVTVNSGESADVVIYTSINDLKTILEKLDVTDMPIETVGVCFDIKVGSESEPTRICKVLKTGNYNENDMNTLYGEYATSAELTRRDDFMLTAPVDFYLKENSHGGITLVVLNKSEYSLNPDWLTVYANGNSLNSFDGYYISDELFPNSIGFYRVDMTVDEIRKANEIGNNEQMTISVKSNNTGSYPNCEGLHEEVILKTY